MAGYANSVLTTGEHIIYETRLHWKIFILPVILCLVYIGIPLLIIAIISKWTSEFVVTNKRVLIKTGFIARRAFDVPLSKIEGIYIEQGVIDRFLGCGTVIVHGTGSSAQPSRNVASPFTFKRMIDEAVEARNKVRPW